MSRPRPGGRRSRSDGLRRWRAGACRNEEDREQARDADHSPLPNRGGGDFSRRRGSERIEAVRAQVVDEELPQIFLVFDHDDERASDLWINASMLDRTVRPRKRPSERSNKMATRDVTNGIAHAALVRDAGSRTAGG